VKQKFGHAGVAFVSEKSFVTGRLSISRDNGASIQNRASVTDLLFPCQSAYSNTD